MELVSVINRSTVVTDEAVEAAVRALQIQVHRDFAPVWGLDADLVFAPKGKAANPESWWLVVLDNSDVAGALGYHDLTPAGRPLGKVFAGTDILYGTSWTVTASHELLELLADPSVNQTATIYDQQGDLTLFALEVADAVESDQFGYAIEGILVSDFVTPAWFDGFTTYRKTRGLAAGEYDFRGLLGAPLQLLPGGYISVLDVTSTDGWQQITADGEPDVLSRGHVGSRREKRRVGYHRWTRSREEDLQGA